jgi:two-component system phosphate regulon sensor histidine kinase PhoR
MRNASPALGIRLKLFLACITLTALSVAITQTIATRQIDGELIGRIRENLFVRLALVAHEASSAAIPPERGPRWDALADDLGGRAQGRVTLIGLDGSLLGDSELSLAELARVENHLNRPEVAAALTAGRGFSERRSPTLDRRMMYVAVPMKRGEQVLGVARLAMPLSDVDAVVGGVGRTVAWGAALALLFATALAGGAAQALSRRTRLLIGVARRMTEGGFDARADERGRDELATLAQALNGLAASHLRASTDLKDQRRIVERVLEAMREGVLVLDGDGRVTLVNAALRRCCSSVGRSWAERRPTAWRIRR